MNPQIKKGTLKKKEKIIASAIKYKGKIYKGLRHRLIIEEIRKKTGEYAAYGTDGFITNTGRFVSRSEAAEIAFKAKQIPSGIYSLDSYHIFKL